MTVTVKGSCNPGYNFDTDEQLCRCDIKNPDIVRCDTDGRYVYIRVCAYVAKYIMCHMHIGRGMEG